MRRSLRKQLSAWVALVLSLHLTCAYSVSFAQPKDKPGASAQPSKDLIAKGQELFDDQQYEDSIQTLSAALLRPNNTREQKIEIYRLLALNYITLGRTVEADSAVRGLLVVRPDYELPESESPRFRDFFREARAKWEAEGHPGLAGAQGGDTAVTIRHGSPSSATPGKTIALKGTLEDPDKLAATVKLYYRTGSKGDFVEAPVEVEAEYIRAQIPGSAVRPPLVDYYFEVLDDVGGVVASRGDAQSPLRIAIPDRTTKTNWVLPIAIGGGIVAVGAIVGGLALAGVFNSSPPPATGGRAGNSTVTVNVGEAGFRF